MVPGESQPTRLTRLAEKALRLAGGALRRCARIACLVALLSPPASVLAASTGVVLVVSEEAEQEFARHGVVLSATSGRISFSPALERHATHRIQLGRGAVRGGSTPLPGHRLANGLCAPLRC